MILAIRLGGNDWELIPEHTIRKVIIKEHIVNIQIGEKSKFGGDSHVYTDQKDSSCGIQIPKTALGRLKATLLTYALGGDTDVFSDDRPGSEEVRKPGKAPSTGPDARRGAGSAVTCS